MNTTRNVSKILFVYLFVILFLQPLELLVSSESGVAGADNGKTNASDGPTLEVLLEKAALSLEGDDKKLSADLYYDVHKQFPETPEAEKSLWHSIGLYKNLARAGKKDWETVRDLYREYISYYPGGEHVAQAYLGVGTALNYMNYQREALTYFKLCIKRFPEDAVANEAKLMQAKVLTDIGRLGEAEEIYNKLAKEETGKVKLRATLGKADILNTKKEYDGALIIYHDLNAKNTNFFRDDLEALRIFGKTNLFAGNVERGQGQLLHYLNLVEDPINRADVLFEIGESYWRQKKFQAANKMYKRAIEEGHETRRSVIFSQMRVANYLDNPESPREKWKKPHELTDPEGDKPYLTVLDLFYNDPYSQEAREGLFWRFKARGDFDNMLDYGKNYLRFSRTKGLDENKQKAGQVFLALAEMLLKNKKYQEVYDIYQSEVETLKDYPDGRLLYFVGQAMDALALYDQAAVIYYRALKWPLTDEDKRDLYYKRANVYILKGDLVAAERLLKHLRKIYKGQKEVGEVYYYSGKLREAQKKEREALEFYRKAVAIMTFPEKKSEYVFDAVRLSLLLEGRGAISKIDDYMKEGYLTGPGLQKMYASAGEMLRLNGEHQKAAEMYTFALADNFPQEGKTAQSIHLYLGDSLLASQKREEGIKHYKEALQGKDSLLKQMAQERLNQDAIEMELSKLKKVGGS